MFKQIRQVMISVITYKRPNELSRMIESLVMLQTELSYRIVIVDNDPEGSAATTVLEYGGSIQYIHEPSPGIAAARNRCIEAMIATDDAIAFLDDDETVERKWLDELVACANSYGVGVVAGPVVSVLPDGCPAWIRRNQMFQRRIRSTGSTDGLPATNNALVSAAVLGRHPDIRFNHEFSVTGGSDSDFFSRLTARGEKFVWCETATVNEYVQLDRASLSWLVRRYTRGGETYARISPRPKALVLAHGAAYVAGGLTCAPFSLILRPAMRRANFVLLTRGIGMMRGSLGKTVKEYQRADFT